MDREKIFNTFFKHDNKGEQKFNGFSQLTPVGKRVTYLIIHLVEISQRLFNPNDTDVFFDACVPGGGPVGPELENRFLH